MKVIFVVGSIFVFILSVSAGTFVETFDDVDLETWQKIVLLDFKFKPDDWKIIDGELHVINTGGLLRLLTMGSEKWRNYTVEVNVFPLKKHGPGNIGIAARVQGTVGVIGLIGDYPFPFPADPEIGLTATCFGGNLHNNKFWLFGSGDSPLLELETWSTLKFEVHEENFMLWLNDKKVLTGRDKTFNFFIGGIGLVVTNYTVKFDNLVISGDGIPNKGRLSVAPRNKLVTMWSSLKQF